MIGTSLALKGLTFVKVDNNEGVGTLYREISRGVSVPTELRIRHRPYTDNRTKRPGWESTITVNRWEALADGTIAIVTSSSKTTRSITDTNVSDADILSNVDIMDQLCNGTAADAGALNKRSDIFTLRDA